MPEFNVFRYTEVFTEHNASYWDLIAKITANSELEAMAVLAAQDATVDNIGQTNKYAACRISAWVTQEFMFKTIAEAITDHAEDRRTIEIGVTT